MRGRRRAATGEGERLRFDRAQVGQLRRLFGFIRPYKKWLAIASFGVAVSAALGLVFPRIMGTLVDTALDDADTSDLDTIALVLVGVFLFQAGFNFLRIYALGVVGEGVVADLRRSVFARIVMLPVPFFDGRKTGEITSRLTSDVAVVQSTVSSVVAQALFQGISMVGGVVLLIILSPMLSLAVLTFLPFIIIGGSFFGRRLSRVSTEFQDEVATANAFADESIASIRVVKWFTAESPATGRYDADIRRSYAIAIRRTRLRAIFVPFVTFLGFGTLAVVLWVGGRQVLDGSLTVGELVTFLLYTLVVAGAIGAFTGLYSQLQEALGASKRIFELLDEAPEIADVTSPVEPERVGSLRFEGVDFTYPGRDIEVLTSIDLDVSPVRWWRWSVRAAPASRRSCNSSRASTTRPQGGCWWTVSTFEIRGWDRFARPWQPSRRRSSCSAARSPKISGSAVPMRAISSWRRPAKPRTPTSSSPAFPTDTRRWSVSGASSSPAGSASAWRSPGPFWPIRGY